MLLKSSSLQITLNYYLPCFIWAALNSNWPALRARVYDSANPWLFFLLHYLLLPPPLPPPPPSSLLPQPQALGREPHLCLFYPAIGCWHLFSNQKSLGAGSHTSLGSVYRLQILGVHTQHYNRQQDQTSTDLKPSYGRSYLDRRN